MDTKKEDTDVKTTPEAPAMPAPGEPGPGPSAVPWEPLHGPVDVWEDWIEGLQSAFRALSVEEVDTHPVKRKRESEKDAGDRIADEGADQGHDPTNDPTFEGARSASGLNASPSPITTTLPTPDPAAATCTPTTNSPMAEGIGCTGIPTYPAYGVNPPTTAFPEATTTSEPVTSTSAPRWYAADYHHPLPATGAYVDVPGEAGSDPRGHLGVTWGVYLCAGKPPLADIILSHPPELTRCDSVIGLAIPAMSGHIQNRGTASGDLYSRISGINRVLLS